MYSIYHSNTFLVKGVYFLSSVTFQSHWLTYLRSLIGQMRCDQCLETPNSAKRKMRAWARTKNIWEQHESLFISFRSECSCLCLFILVLSVLVCFVVVIAFEISFRQLLRGSCWAKESRHSWVSVLRPSMRLRAWNDFGVSRHWSHGICPMMT